ncbi:MAG TPA: GNAT family N-acetyltransferase [Acidimicrobiales bacterium]|nr:GNAT family N-acetyltransferase [Acidimicrobiales bacterium]
MPRAHAGGHGAGAVTVELRTQPSGSGRLCRDILATLPHWFGITESVEHYVDVAEREETMVASIGGRDVGFATLVHHSPHAAEIYVMGVVPEHHRAGIGRMLLECVETDLARAGVEFLQVKTLSPRRPDEGYERTRAFYFAHGFVVFEELPELWDSSNPALVLVKKVAAPPAT